MISRKAQGFYFTVQDLIDETGLPINTVRSRVGRLVERGAFIKHAKLRPTNQNVYRSSIDPMVVLGERAPEIFLQVVPGFFNNPFKLKNAIDMRWKS